MDRIVLRFSRVLRTSLDVKGGGAMYPSYIMSAHASQLPVKHTSGIQGAFPVDNTCKAVFKSGLGTLAYGKLRFTSLISCIARSYKVFRWSR
jgi:hypothetical protein